MKSFTGRITPYLLGLVLPACAAGAPDKHSVAPSDSRPPQQNASASTALASGEPEPARHPEASESPGAEAPHPQEPDIEPCSDAHVAAGGCKAGFWEAEHQLCFRTLQAACRCACGGNPKTCEAPAATAGPPGPVTPEVTCP